MNKGKIIMVLFILLIQPYNNSFASFDYNRDNECSKICINNTKGNNTKGNNTKGNNTKGNNTNNFKNNYRELKKEIKRRKKYHRNLLLYYNNNFSNKILNNIINNGMKIDILRKLYKNNI